MNVAERMRDRLLMWRSRFETGKGVSPSSKERERGCCQPTEAGPTTHPAAGFVVLCCGGWKGLP